MYYRVTSLILLGVLLLGSLAWAGDKTEAEAKALSAKERALVLAKSAKSEVDGAFLGIIPEEVTSDIASDYGVQTGQGVLVESVVGGSPAEKAGLRSNDILMSINGQKLTGPAELRVQLNKFKPGDEVSLVYKRGGNERSAAVKLEGKEREFGDMRWFSMGKEDAPMPPVFRWEGMKPSSAAFAGVVTQELSDGLKKYFKVEGGALISEVVENSPAEKAGLKAGDVITKVGQEAVSDEGDVRDAIRESSPDATIDFHIIRDGKPMVIPVTLTNRKDFYGDIPGVDGENFYFGFGETEAKELAAEMEKLQQELNGIGVELEKVPQINMDLRIHPDGARFFISDGEARAISRDESWWNWNFQDLRSKVKLGMEELKKEMEVLKSELKRLQSELRERMSSIWSPVIEVISQA